MPLEAATVDPENQSHLVVTGEMEPSGGGPLASPTRS
jgi:hypothetical protein